MNKLKILNTILILIAFVSILGCSITKIQQKGYIVPGSFHYKSHFSTIKTIIVLPVEINGAIKNFLFDTGADVTLMQRDTIKGNTKEISGATNHSMKLGNEIIKSIKIGDVEFVDTYVMSGDFIGLKEQVPNFGGLIGQSIISKANWLIDYPNKMIELSNQKLIDNTFKAIHIKREGGTPFVYLSIDGKKYKAIIDLGSSAALAIPENTELAKYILSKYNFNDNERKIYTIGGVQKTKEKVGKIPSINLEGFEFKNIETNIRHTSELRIGNDFFKDYIIYIDNINSNYSLKKIN